MLVLVNSNVSSLMGRLNYIICLNTMGIEGELALDQISVRLIKS